VDDASGDATVHILGELAKPVSLSCRLFGNIFGEDTLIVVFVSATALLLKASLSLLAVPPWQASPRSS